MTLPLDARPQTQSRLYHWFDQCISSIGDKRLKVTVSLDQAPKTTQQLRYYFGVLVRDICIETGSDKDSVDGYLRSEFLETEIFHFQGKPVVKTPSLADKSVGDLADYIDQCCAWASRELGIVVPPPE